MDVLGTLLLYCVTGYEILENVESSGILLKVFAGVGRYKFSFYVSLHRTNVFDSLAGPLLKIEFG